MSDNGIAHLPNKADRVKSKNTLTITKRATPPPIVVSGDCSLQHQNFEPVDYTFYMKDKTYEVDDHVRVQSVGLFYKCIVAGTTAPDVEPVWQYSFTYRPYLNSIPIASLVGSTLTTLSASIALIGTSTILARSHIFGTESTLFVMSGIDINAFFGIGMQSSSVAFNLSGTNSAFRMTRQLRAVSALFSLYGPVAIMIPHRMEIEASGSYTLDGTTNRLIKHNLMVVTSHTFSMSVTSKTSHAGRKIVSTSGTFALLGSVVPMVPHRMEIETSGTFAMTGTAAVLTYGFAVALGDPYWSNTTLLMHMDSTAPVVDTNVKLLLHMDGAQDGTTFTDVVGHAVTNTGVTLYTDRAGYHPVFGTAMAWFGSSGGSLSIPNSTDFDFGSGDFTVEFWAGGSFTYTELAYKESSTPGRPIWMISGGASGDIVGYISNLAGDSWDVVAHNTGNLVGGVFNHIAFVRSGTSVKLYVNGIAGASPGTKSGALVVYASPVTIGGFISNGYFNGYMDELRINKGTAVYTVNFTPPVTTLTNTMIPFTDERGHTVTINGGAAVSTSLSKFGAASGKFLTTTGDFISVADQADTQLGSGDFTVEFWMNTSHTPTDFNYMVGKRTVNGYGWNISLGTNGKPSLYISTNGTTWGTTINATGSSLADSLWHHIAAVRSASTCYLFVDGVSVGTTAISGTVYNVADPLRIGRFSDGNADTFQGYIDEFRLTKFARYTSNFLNDGDPYFSKLAVLISGDGANGSTSITDFNGNSITLTGATQISSSIKKFGTGSIYFSNADYYTGSDTVTVAISTPKALAANLGTSWTLEFWAYPLISQPNALYVQLLGNNGSLNLNCESIQGGGSFTDGTVNTWTHWAVVHDGSTVTLYKNGAVARAAYSFTNPCEALGRSNTLYIGCDYTLGSTFSGYIDDFRFSGGVRYTGAFTPPTTANPTYVAACTITAAFGSADLWNNYQTTLLKTNAVNAATNNTFIDGSSNNLTVTKYGNATQGSFSPFSNSGWSTSFNGTGDGLTLTGSSNLAFGTGDFTIEFWMFSTVASQSGMIYDSRPTGTSGIYPTIRLNSGTLYFYTNGATRITGPTIAVNSWTQIVISRASGDTKLFINGVQSGSTYTDSNSYINGSSRPLICADGYDNYSGANYFTGYISNLRIVKGTAVYTANFTPSTTALTAITNTVFLTCQDGRFVDNSSNHTAITVSGSPLVKAFSPFVSTYDPAVNGGSVYFDGAGDHLYLAPNVAWDWGTGDWTQEAYVYHTTAPAGFVFSNWNGGLPPNVWGEASAVTASGSVIFLYMDNGSYSIVLETAPGLIPLNTWNHIAWTRLGNVFTIWVNGVASATTTYSQLFTASNPFIVGGGYYNGIIDYNFAGYISNARVIKGTAIYTANFTPPTAPLTAITNTKLLLQGNNAGIYDALGTTDIETVGSAQVSTSTKKYVGSMYFNGTTDYITAPYSSTFSITSLDATIEFWINPTGTQTAYAPVVSQNKMNDGVQTSFSIQFEATGTKFILYFGAGGSTINSFTSSTVITAGTWTHIALVKVGTSFTLYQQGVSVLTGTCGNWQASTQPLIIGAGYDTNGTSIYSGRYFNGYIEDFRITKGLARYTTNFTPPTGPLTH